MPLVLFGKINGHGTQTLITCYEHNDNQHVSNARTTRSVRSEMLTHTHARNKLEEYVNLANPPGKSAQARGNNTVMKFPNRLYNRFLLLAIDTIANGQSFLLLAVDPHANGPSRVNNPPTPSLGGFTKPSIPKLAIRSDPHDRHKSRYGFCHVLSCLTVLMQCFCLVTF